MNPDEDMFSLEGKVALVTGASRGLGKAMAVGLARAGADVCVISLSGSNDETLEAIRAAGRKAFGIKADLSSRQERAGLADKVVAELGRLDILVNNAGDAYRQPAVDYSLDKWDHLISLMLTAVFELSQQAARQMMKQGQGGKIVNTASLMSFFGGWTIPAYTAAKHGVAGLTKALCNEWAEHGINVNALAPGYMETDLTEPVLTNPDRAPRIMSRIPAGRWGKPEDMVGPVVFLASAASDYLHGQIICVDGGWMAR